MGGEIGGGGKRAEAVVSAASGGVAEDQGGTPLSHSHLRRGVVPSPLRFHFFLQGGRPERRRPPGQPPEIPLRRVEATEGGGGRGRGGEDAPLHGLRGR
ncbi:hypothetical protein Sjap_024842 [Stephania japonica]|uniref:Uncharacterized protein n=1 Tax=Stephania japonica TaxID=461633 RepID=A0AAP0HQH5_9MAGN